MAEVIFFYVFSAVMLGSAVLVVSSRQPVYSVLSLLVAMFCLAALFVLLGAYFVAALQILLYAGAVLVLFLFVIMLLGSRETLARRTPTLRLAAGVAVAVIICAQFAGVVLRSRITSSAGSLPPETTTVERIARELFTTYLLPFELTSFLILAAIIGAVSLAQGLWTPKSK